MGSGHRCVCRGPDPFVTNLQMGSSSCHPFRRRGALTGALRPPAAICPSFARYRPLDIPTLRIPGFAGIAASHQPFQPAGGCFPPPL